MPSAAQDNERVDEKLESALTIFSGEFPSQAVLYAIDNQEKTTPVFLNYLEYAIENVAQLSEDYCGHLYALFLLSQFREKKAFSLVMKLCHLSIDEQTFLLGDCLTEHLHRFIASTYDGEFAAIQDIIENPKIDFCVRGQALDALLVLLNHNLIAKEAIDSYVLKLFEKFIEHKDIDGMTALVGFWVDYKPSGFALEIKKAFSLELVNEDFIDLEEALELVKLNDPLYLDNSNYAVITNTIEEMADWSCFREEGADEFEALVKENFDGLLPTDISQQVKALNDNISPPGRDEPCFCGSGKPFKKCCLN